MKSLLRPSPRRSGRVLAFLALGVFPPAILSGCDKLFHKDVDAGVDAAAEVVVEDAAVEIPAAEPVESVEPPKTTPGLLVRGDAGAKHLDAGLHDAAVPVPPVIDAGKIPTPIPSGMRLPAIPSGLRIPSGFPSRFLPR